MTVALAIDADQSSVRKPDDVRDHFVDAVVTGNGGSGYGHGKSNNTYPDRLVDYSLTKRRRAALERAPVHFVECSDLTPHYPKRGSTRGRSAGVAGPALVLRWRTKAGKLPFTCLTSLLGPLPS